MTVQDLIEELQKMPKHKFVNVVLSEIYTDDELGMRQIYLEESDSIEAQTVSDRGAYVLIESK